MAALGGKMIELDILKLVVSATTPLVILILGILINRTLEKNKVALSKEQDWQNWWAGKFLDIAHSYNTAVSECVTSVSTIQQIGSEKLPGWEKEFKEKETAIRLNVRNLQYLDWEIQNYIQFAPSKGLVVKDKQKQLFDLLAELLASRQEDFENIRAVQFDFNEAIRLAHAEILDLPPNKALQRTSR